MAYFLDLLNCVATKKRFMTVLRHKPLGKILLKRGECNFSFYLIEVKKLI